MGEKGSIEHLRRFHGSPIYGDEEAEETLKETCVRKLLSSVHQFKNLFELLVDTFKQHV